MTGSSQPFVIDSRNGQLSAEIVPWDSSLFDFPVAQISRLEVFDSEKFDGEFKRIFSWQKSNGLRLISCRLQHQCLPESFLLERNDFRFIEMVLHPTIADLQTRCDFGNTGLDVDIAEPEEVEQCRQAAARSFTHERFHLDPRLDSTAANQRYAWFVEAAQRSSDQQLMVVREGQQVVAFFITEERENHLFYWHLTSVLPEFAGKGYGYRAWLAMLSAHRDNGGCQVVTTISARNTAVLGLYAKLGFRFLPPDMTFHWYGL